LKNSLVQKEQELMKNIEKHNQEKEKLMDELDGRSEMIRNVRFDTEGQVSLLKEQIEALETKLKGTEEDLQKEVGEVSKLKNALSQKEQELMKNIEKHNQEKEKLMDELDGRSEMIRNVRFDTEGQVSLLKEQIEALETKLKGTEEDLQKEVGEVSKLKRVTLKIRKSKMKQG
jgi:chromosome segregation ATPase